jgi:large subunit ribosomal protein L5
MLDLKEKFEKEAVPKLMKEFNYKNPMMVPKLTKVVVNRGIGEATQNTKLIDAFVEELEAVVGQKVMITKSKKSIATFKVREGQAIGCKVTLRNVKMYHFLNKFINIALPKVRDFRGVNKSSFDGRGNYTIGIQEQIIFPEIKYEKVVKLSGMDITICTTAKTDKEAYVLLEALGMPFRK